MVVHNWSYTNKVIFVFFYNGPPLGVAIYGRALLKRLVPKIAETGSKVLILCSNDAFQLLSNEQSLSPYCIKKKALNRFFLRIPYLILAQIFDLRNGRTAIVNLMNPIVSPIKNKSIKVISVIHDLNEFECSNKYGGFRSKLRRFLLKTSLLFSDKIVCISDNTAQQLNQFFDKIPNGYHVITNGAGNDLFIYDRIPSKRILVVGRIDPLGKNLNQAWNTLSSWMDEDKELEVIFVGGMNESTRADGEAFLSMISSHIRATYLGHVSDAELSRLYATSELLLFLSLLEGFGMPPFEALRASCPVVAHTKNRILRSLLGDSILYITPEQTIPSFREIRSKINELDLVAGKDRAETYTWDAAANAYLDTINGIFSN